MYLSFRILLALGFVSHSLLHYHCIFSPHVGERRLREGRLVDDVDIDRLIFLQA